MKKTNFEIFDLGNGSALVYDRNIRVTFNMSLEDAKIVSLYDLSYTNIQISTMLGIDESQVSKTLESFRYLKRKKSKKKSVKKMTLVYPDNSIPTLLCNKNLYITYVTISFLILFISCYCRYSVVNSTLKSLLENFGNSALLISIPVFVISTFIHEAGHVIAAKANGAYVTECGIMLYGFIPCGYTSVCGLGEISSASRILVFFGGVLNNITILGISSWFLDCRLWWVQIIATEIFIINLALVMINLLIFLKMDGYYILEELTEKGLRDKAWICIKSVLTNHSKANYSLSEIIGYAVYSVLSLLFVPCFAISMIYEMIM